jgi:hypothetical protein
VRVALPFRIGVRTLASASRRLVRVPLSLADALLDSPPVLPPLLDGADGLLVTSLPVDRLAALDGAKARLLLVRQRYRRSWIDLEQGHDAWWRGRSAQARSGLGRKARRLGGATVRRYADAAEIAAFLPLAQAVARRSYQHRLPDAALPDTPAFAADAVARAAADEARGWLLFVDGAPVAYLFCTTENEGERDGAGDTLRYDHVGHDPAHAALSPGSVLQLAAVRDLMAEGRFARFDLLEGDGRHKRLFASDGVDCCDVLLLRDTIRNRALAAALAGFDAGVARAGRSERLRRWTRALRR